MKDVDDNVDDGHNNLDDGHDTVNGVDDLNLLLTSTSRAVRGALPDQSRRGRRSGLRWKIALLLCFLDLLDFRF